MVIKKAEYVISCVKKEQYDLPKLPEFSMMGRSNVGKSSFINSLCHRKKLAYTSSKPGKTLTLNFYNINDAFYLVDFPGYGYAKRTIEHRLDFGKMYEDYLPDNKELKLCFLIVDLRHEPTEDDVLMYNYLKYLNKKVCVVATKADKLTRNEQNKNVQIVKKVLDIKEGDYFVKFCSIDETGKEEIYEIISSLI